MRVIAINTDAEGNCRCIKANCHKMGWANLMGGVIGGAERVYGFIATAVIEIDDDSDTIEHGGRMLQVYLHEDGETELGELSRKTGTWRLGHADDEHNGD